ncbi:MAG TPA: DUF3619 family protein [Methylibium sp.]|nr:DUF3619 family protein [Methylibium sp.]
MIDRRLTAPPRPQDPSTREARYALRVAARLSERSDELPHDIGERLRFAREQALARARTAREAASSSSHSGGAAVLGGGWWPRLAAALPVLALAAALVLVQTEQQDEQLRTAVETDAALLADDLPPSAYTDPGFAEFLKAPAPVRQ